jgi:aspartyl-tRNA(Asn)/glutamyl-tRNA(Gln) amidotransferase subunit A
MIKEKLKLIKEGRLSPEENIKNFLEEIKKNDKQGKKINAFLEINPNALLEAKEVCSKLKIGKAGRLAGLAIAAKSNISVKRMHATCASKTLEKYKCGYDSTVVKKIREEDGIIIGYTNMDEFAAGSSGETSAFGKTLNPNAIDRIPGGSSSGSAAAVAAGFCDIALGSDTGGSIRNPASHCGIVGIKPTYGTVSRYGLLDLSMSLEQIGSLASSVEDTQLLLDVIKGKDEHDTTTFEVKDKKVNLKKIKVGIPKIKADKKIWELIKKRVEEVCKREGWGSSDVSMKYIDLGVQAYYPINYVEFYSATRKYDGRRFGEIIEEVCGDEVLRRILGGSLIAEEEHAGKYYRKALQAKKLIEQEFDKTLKKYDCLIMPTSPKLPHKFGEKITTEDMYQYDTLTVLANLAGVPAISIPAGKINEVPVGLQIICKKFDDNKMLEIAKKFEII